MICILLMRGKICEPLQKKKEKKKKKLKKTTTASCMRLQCRNFGNIESVFVVITLKST